MYDKNNPQGFEVGDTVYTLRVIGRSNSCEAPSELFARRGDQLTIVDIEYPNQYSKVTWFVVKHSRGIGMFHVTSGDITKMKHFDWNYSELQKEFDRIKEREYSGWY